jgi:hypothetical protein
MRPDAPPTTSLPVCTVAMMMYGFGDVRTPLPESVELLEDIVCDFLTKMVRRSVLLRAHPCICKLLWR